MRSSDSPGWDAPAEPENEGRAEYAHFALENLFEFSPDAIFVTDGAGTIRDANPRATELFGYTRTEFAGMNCRRSRPGALQRPPSQPSRKL